jgi:hypothetical protein
MVRLAVERTDFLARCDVIQASADENNGVESKRLMIETVCFHSTPSNIDRRATHPP